MEIGRGRRYVAQAGDAHQLRLWRTKRMEDTVPLKQVAADVHALVARDAAQRLEQLIAGELLRRNRAGVALKPAIEAAARRRQRTLESGDSVQQVVVVGPASISVSEPLHDVGVSPQLANDFFDARPHELRTANPVLDLALERAKVALPIQTKAQNRIEYCQRVKPDRFSLRRRIVGIRAGAVRSCVMAR